MYEFATRADFQRFTRDQTLQESASKRITASRRDPRGATFLSHSSKDDELVDGAIKVLENHGGTVYIDKVDPTMPPYTNSEAASKLKERVNQCRKFVLLASENSKESRWVPWELGIADGYKSLSRIAIFPTVESNARANWTSWEYIGLYNQIVYGDLADYENKVWMVIDRKRNVATELRRWLTGS